MPKNLNGLARLDWIGHSTSGHGSDTPATEDEVFRAPAATEEKVHIELTSLLLLLVHGLREKVADETQVAPRTWNITLSSHYRIQNCLKSIQPMGNLKGL